METIIKPNDLIDQILAIAAELSPVAKHYGYGEPWAKMLATRDPKDFLTVRDNISREFEADSPLDRPRDHLARLHDLAQNAGHALTGGQSMYWLCAWAQNSDITYRLFRPLLMELRKGSA